MGHPRDLHLTNHSFRTRRSSDPELQGMAGRGGARPCKAGRGSARRPGEPHLHLRPSRQAPLAGEFEQPYMAALKQFLVAEKAAGRRIFPRGAEGSEEHTSELQSLLRISYAVFCFKKKNKI